jgi:hypothetical protein
MALKTKEIILKYLQSFLVFHNVLWHVLEFKLYRTTIAVVHDRLVNALIIELFHIVLNNVLYPDPHSIPSWICFKKEKVNKLKQLQSWMQNTGTGI